ncbi:MAG: hypothetical protein KAY24_20015 [Candidatus Eisenbacteria sp.]|nr:hypothetical protein [Candidatus Eisenbacteria bacterium]
MSIFRNRNRFKPPSDGSTTVRLIAEEHEDFAGNKAPYYDYFEHFYVGLGRRGKGRGFICSRSWREDEDLELHPSGKCLLCAEKEDGNKAISARRLQAFLMLHLDWYYLIPAEDNNGNIVMYENDSRYHKKGDPIMNRVHEEQAIDNIGRRAIEREGHERVFGKLMHWSLGTNHLLALSARMIDIRKSCRCGGRIAEIMWECRGCDAEILDLTPEGRQNLDMTKKEITAMLAKPYKCKCGHEDLMRPILECSDCRDPNPLQIWDVNLEVSRQGEGTQSVVVVHEFEYADIPEDAAELLPDDNRNILHRVFAADSLKYQADAMGIKNPYDEDDTRRHVQEYDKDADDNSEPSDTDLPF